VSRRLLRVAAVLLDVAGCTVLRGACALVAIDTADELRAYARRGAR